MKKFIMLLSVLCMSGLVTNGVTSADVFAEEAKTEIQVLVPGYDSGYLTEPLDAAISKYEEANPQIDVKIVSAGWDELNSKIVQLYQSGQAPDIMLVGSRSIRQFAELGVLEDVSPYMTEEFKANRIENILDTGKIKDVQYGIPMALSSRTLFYRSDLVEKAPTNWEELLSTAKQLKADKGIYGFAIPTDSRDGVDELLNFFYQNGGRMVDENGEYTLNSEANIETLEYLSQFKDLIPDPVGTARSDQAKMFANGDLAIYISGGWEKEEMDKGVEKAPYLTALVPAGKEKAVTLVTDSYVISSISKHKEEAWKFVEFMGSEEIQPTISQAYNWLPVIKSELKEERFTTDFMKPMVEILEFGVPEPQVPNWDEYSQSFSIAVQKAMTGQATAKEALDAAQEELTK